MRINFRYESSSNHLFASNFRFTWHSKKKWWATQKKWIMQHFVLGLRDAIRKCMTIQSGCCIAFLLQKILPIWFPFESNYLCQSIDWFWISIHSYELDKFRLCFYSSTTMLKTIACIFICFIWCDYITNGRTVHIFMSHKIRVQMHTVNVVSRYFDVDHTISFE